MTTSLLKRRAALFTLSALTLAVYGPAAQAQDAAKWPTRTVRLITPYPTGGAPDTIARVLAEKLSRKWGQSVIVENKPGGNGFIAIDAFKRGAKDGHDLIQLDSVHIAAYPYLFKKLPYDPAKDFDVQATLWKAYLMFVVPTGSKYKTVGDVIADAKANPGKIDYGSWSIGNPVHLGMEELQQLTGTSMQHVVYKETSQLYTAVATGELPVTLGTAGTTGPMYKAGKVRFLAVGAPQRLVAYPDVPTVAEAGGPKDYEVSGWNVIATPKGLPLAVRDKIRQDIAEAVASTDVQDRYATLGYVPLALDRAKIESFIQAETKRHEAIIKRAKIELQ
ncbi:Bug family tripartite tricarboxylate transporter substrate binding protein [Variovorax sp. RT4R15]|uniref:Bug family tripartite tricarboxylate transporter substrate binding protein n=1 Tax=Variovorax sp. RT4R15 TaxID=3443737 RepID=UPI003F45A39E